jgi:hypothetical protein
MEWLGDLLKFNKKEDWYNIRCDHFFNNKGRSLLALYGYSPFQVVARISFIIIILLVFII